MALSSKRFRSRKTPRGGSSLSHVVFDIRMTARRRRGMSPGNAGRPWPIPRFAAAAARNHHSTNLELVAAQALWVGTATSHTRRTFVRGAGLHEQHAQVGSGSVRVVSDHVERRAHGVVSLSDIAGRSLHTRSVVVPGR